MKTSIKKNRKICIYFSQRGQSMVWAKNFKFLDPFFLSKIGREKVFGDVLGRILACLDYENIDKEKKSRNLHFSKGISPWF